MPIALAVLTQVLSRLPGGSKKDTVADSAHLTPQVGRAARRLLSDSLAAAPQQLGHWVTSGYAAFVRLLPRLAVAFAVAAIILALTAWVRAIVRRRAGPAPTPAYPTAIAVPTAASVAARGVQMLGVLLAALLAAWIVSATALAAAILTFGVFYAGAVTLGILGARARLRVTAPEAVDLALTVARYAVLILGTVEALDTLGLNLGGVIAGLGILGLAVGFAAQDAFANIIAGFMILWDRSLRVGDWVRIKDAEGRVRRITLRTTRIETRDEGILVIPNKEVTGATLHNFSLRESTRVRVPVGVSYDTNVDTARPVLLALLADESVVAAEPPPFVAVTALGDSTVTLELVFFVNDPRELAPLRWRLFEAILREFRRREIEIAFPQLDVRVRGAETGVVL
ncbi:MAG: mechanosensitive ion channel family protein [Candidatus Eremiobacteraeota bacterium]|nr:mechanosensitive ion channel family protein [Candidatus Eremiobacteraeota bacterium]